MLPVWRHKAFNQGQECPNYVSLWIFLTCRQIYAESKGIFLSTCIFDINSFKSFIQLRAIVGADQCNAFGSIRLDDRTIGSMMWGNWWEDTFHAGCGYGDHLGALRSVHVTGTFKMSNMEMSGVLKYLTRVLGEKKFEWHI